MSYLYLIRQAKKGDRIVFAGIERNILIEIIDDDYKSDNSPKLIFGEVEEPNQEEGQG